MTHCDKDQSWEPWDLPKIQIELKDAVLHKISIFVIKCSGSKSIQPWKDIRWSVRWMRVRIPRWR